jgi:hypothetical protein
MHPLRIARWNNGHHPGLDDGRRNLRADVGGRTDHKRAGAGPLRSFLDTWLRDHPNAAGSAGAEPTVRSDSQPPLEAESRWEAPE